MTCHVHEFDPEEGGRVRVLLTYDGPAGVGKTTSPADTYHGRFVKLLPNHKIVEMDEFETTDPALRGEMIITITLTEVGGGTDLIAAHEGLPRGLSAENNETGWRMALAKLARLVEVSQ